MSDRWGALWLEQLIAVGGLGEVWRATKDGQVGALKRLHTHLARNDEARAIFAQEQHLVMELPRHPNVIHGIETGAIDAADGASLPYAFLELAPGADLRRIVAPPATRERPTSGVVALPRARTIAIVADACDAVAHLHANGWVHGDVNPSNLIVSPATPLTDSGPANTTLKGMTAIHRVTLVDLGVARRIGEGGPTRGTHAYMAPEQVRAQPWTTATDVFALGILLWELTANTRLFHRGPTWLSMAAVVEADVPALPDRELDAIARAALVKDPLQRLSSAAELATQLRTLDTN